MNSALSWLPIVSVCIAALALFRPELERWYRRRRTKIEFYPAGRIEIGFSDFGPTLGVHGTLASMHHNQLIKDMRIELVRRRDQATHEFEWGVFRSLNVVQNTSNVELQTASAFSVNVDQPKKINFQFHDVKTKDLYVEPVLRLRRAFEEFCRNSGITLIPNNASQIYNQYHQQSTNLIGQVYSDIKSRFYWEDGEYKINIKVNASNPDKAFSYVYSFTLTAEEAQLLSQNVVALMNAACYVPVQIWQFAHPRIVPA